MKLVHAQATCVKLPVESDASTTLRDTRDRASRSFSFFVRAVLGKRSFAESRLEALASGEASPSAQEAKLLGLWLKLRSDERRCAPLPCFSRAERV